MTLTPSRLSTSCRAFGCVELVVVEETESRKRGTEGTVPIVPSVRIVDLSEKGNDRDCPLRSHSARLDGCLTFYGRNSLMLSLNRQ